MAVRTYNFSDSLRDELREAGLGPGDLLRWTGAALVCAALVAVVVTAIHRAGWGLLIALMIGVALLVLGAMLLIVDRRAARAAITEQAGNDLRTAADVILKESRHVGEMTRDPRVDLDYEVPLHIEWFADYSDRLTRMLRAHGLAPDRIEPLRVRRGPDGRVAPPAAIEYDRLESEIDLLNVLVQYRDALLDVLDDGAATRA